MCCKTFWRLANPSLKKICKMNTLKCAGIFWLVNILWRKICMGCTVTNLHQSYMDIPIYKKKYVLLLGWGNLLKMKVLPKFAYLFRHSSYWLLKSFFLPTWIKFSPIFYGAFTLQDKHFLHKYFLATQLVTAAWWLSPDCTNSSTMLEAAFVRTLEALHALIFHVPKDPCSLTPSTATTIRAWKASLAIEKYRHHGVT